MRICPTTCLTALLLLVPVAGWGADYAMGKAAYDSADYETALAEWQALAQEGDVEGQFGMGLLYSNGFGVAMDDAEALKWYRLAAEQGHAEAQCNLAIIHANGWGVPINDEEAFKWYEKAAEQGLTAAQVNLARMYESGFGVPQDKIRAHMWYHIAAELGDMDANVKRDGLEAKMSKDDIDKANGLALTWMENHHRLLARE